MSDLVKRLHEVSDAITNGLRLASSAVLVEAADHIEAQDARIRELEMGRANWRDEAHRMDKARDHFLGERNAWLSLAQKLREAHQQIDNLDEAMGHDITVSDAFRALEIARKALALTPTSALSAVRDEVREECAKIAEVQADKEDHAVGFLCSQEIAAAIRARKETGE